MGSLPTLQLSMVKERHPRWIMEERQLEQRKEGGGRGGSPVTQGTLAKASKLEENMQVP